MRDGIALIRGGRCAVERRERCTCRGVFTIRNLDAELRRLLVLAGMTRLAGCQNGDDAGNEDSTGDG